jgi:pyrrolidone-carboxylate peptidase
VMSNTNFTVNIVVPPVSQSRARITSISPLQIIANVEEFVTITVKGRGLIEANATKMFGLRCPANITMEMTDPIGTTNTTTGEETLKFGLKVKSASPLLPSVRVMIQFMASLRPNAVTDLVTEDSNFFLTVLPNKSPVALAYTDTLSGGESQIIMVAGRNLNGTKLRLKGSKGVELLDHRSEDRHAVMVVSVPDPAKAVPGTLELTTGTGTLMGSYPLLMTNSPDARIPGKPLMPKLVQVPGQMLMTPQRGNSRVYLLRTKQPLPSSDPQFNNNTNIPGQFVLDRVTQEIPLFNETVFFNVTDRGGDSLLTGGQERKKGRVLRVRNLDFLVVLQVNLTVTTDIIAYLLGNPFADFPSTQGFNAFSSGTPAGTFGTVTLELDIVTTFGFSILFVAALVKPPRYKVPELTDFNRLSSYPEANPTRPLGLEMVEIASFRLTAEFPNTPDGPVLKIGPNFLRVDLEREAYMVRPSYMGDGLRLLTQDGLPSAEIAFPDPSGFGLCAYFFAEKPGQHCFQWVREVKNDKRMQVKLGLIGSPMPPEVLVTVPTVTVCLNIAAGPTYIYGYVPAEPKIELGTSQIVWVYPIKVEGANNEKKTIEEKFVDPNSYKIVSEKPGVVEARQLKGMNEPAGSVEDWYLLGKTLGDATIKLDFKLSTATTLPNSVTAGSFPLLPEQKPQFTLIPNVFLGLLPDVSVPFLKEDLMTKTQVQVTALQDGTKELNLLRNKLWREYVAQTAPGKSAVQAWENLPFSKRAVFLTITHKLYYAQVNVVKAQNFQDVVDIAGRGIKRLLQGATSLLTLRGMAMANDTGDDTNRMFMQLNPALARGIHELAKSKGTSSDIAISDETAANYPGMPGMSNWLPETSSESPFTLKIMTPTDKPPVAYIQVLAETQYYVDTTKFPARVDTVDSAKLISLLGSLSTKTAKGLNTAEFNDKITRRPTGKPTRDGSEIAAFEVPAVMEFSIEYEKDKSSTEFNTHKFKFMTKNLKGTGRRIYDYFYGNGKPVDLGWNPSPCMQQPYLPTGEEAFGTMKIGAVDAQDFFIAKDAATAAIVMDFANALNAISPNDANPKPKVAAAVETHGSRLLARSRDMVEANDFANADDRILYWARLKMAVALKSTPYMTCALNRDREEILRLFESKTRGYDGINFAGRTDAFRVLLVGFDTFDLRFELQIPNPSASVALALHNKEIVVGGKKIFIQGAVVPVRYRDFDQDAGSGPIEAMLKRVLDQGGVDMVLTMSRASTLDVVEVERFGVRLREVGIIANDGLPHSVTATGRPRMIHFPVDVPGYEFYESNLPVEKIIPADSMGKSYRIIHDNTFFYKLPTGGEFSYAVNFTNDLGPLKIEVRDPMMYAGKIPTALTTTSTPKKSEILGTFSAVGSFLSNELFYRAARFLTETTPRPKQFRTPSANVLVSHLHFPFFNRNEPERGFDAVKTQELILEVKDIISNTFK